MALKTVNGVVHEIEKIHRGICDNCKKEICVGWKVSHSLNARDGATIHCYNCTNNQWAKALKLHKDATHK